MQKDQNNMKNQEKDQNAPKRQATSFFAKITARLAEKDEWEVRGRVSRAVGFITAAVITYLLGGVELFFGTYPICIALACSHKSMLAPIAAGALALIITGDLPPLYAFAAVSVILIRALAALLPFMLAELNGKKDKQNLPVPISQESEEKNSSFFGAAKRQNEGEAHAPTYVDALFCEPQHVKLLCAAIGGTLCGLFLMIQNAFSFYSLYGTLFMALSCPIFVFLFSGYFGTKEAATAPRAFIAFMSIAPLCVIFATQKTIIGMPMAPFLCMLLTLYISSKKGMIWGVGAALVCGLAYNYTYVPLLAFAAIIFCIISSFKEGAGLAAVCALVVIWCYYIGGSLGLVSVLPPMLLAIPIYMSVDKYRRIMHAPYNKDAILSGGVFFAQAVTEKTKNQAVCDRLGALSDAFASISETFYKLSDRLRRPDMLDPAKICDDAFSKNCNACHNRELCWGAGYSDTQNAIKSAAGALHSRGDARESDLPDAFRSVCPKYKKILLDVDRSVKEKTESILKSQKINLFASSYEDMTAILNDALGADSEEYQFDTEAGERIFDLLYSQGFKLSGVAVYGKRCINVVIKGVSITDKISTKKQAELCAAIGELVGVELGEPRFELGQDGTLMRLCSKPQFSAKCAGGSISASELTALDGTRVLTVDPFSNAEDELCGDTVSSFISDSSYFYALISDGMGTGAEAAFTSGVCSMFIEKMLCAGNRSDITLRVLNNAIRSENSSRGGEISATIDLFQLDLIDGSAIFMKSGAAPTYVVRGETVYKINSHTMPIGIIKTADVKLTRFDTRRGDIIIMMSDGCCPDSDDCTWLVDFLCEYTRRDRGKNKKEPDECDCEALRDTLLSLARRNYPAERDGDDISINVIRIE
ncbi:MAG: SpoIIE family protein phosphatase [Clostridia bacterium]|nr:SpoIIE family protein phosphatase [Clostridia bacterium]